MTASSPAALARAHAHVRAPGAEEAVVDLPTPLDDETIERWLAPVRERLA
jgi:hypothetical protein